MALTPKEEQRLAELQARKNKQTRINKSTQEEIDDLLARQSQKLSDQLKLAKQISQAEKEHEKLLKSSEKSLSSILGHLIKGNVAQAAQEAFTKKTAGTSILLSAKYKEITNHLQKSNSYGAMSAENQAKIRETVAGINSGMYGQAELAATIEDIGKERIKDSSDLSKKMTELVNLSEGDKKAKEKTEKAQKALNKLIGEFGAAFGVLVATAAKFGDRIDKIGEAFGSLTVLGKEFRKDLLNSSVEATKLGGGISEVASISNALASNFGITLQDSIELSSKIFDTSKALGLSADEGANLFGVLTQTANLSGEQAERLAESTFQLAKQNGVAPSQVMKDIAGSSEAIANFTKDGAGNIATAAIQARQMGISLDTTAKIAEGLLDFENSITKEVEASVLLGKQLNFQKAREAALNGDIAGATQEVVKQLGSEADFNRLNLIQRKALADSIGVSVTEMSKLVGETGKLDGSLGDRFRDLLGEEALSNFSKLTNNVKALTEAFVVGFGPALSVVAGILNVVVGALTATLEVLNKMGATIPIVSAALTALGLRSIGIATKGMGVQLAGFAAKVLGFFGGLGPFAIPAAAAVTAAGTALISKVSKMNDGVIGPGGITTMMGPAGIFSLNPRDSVLATTNPIPVNDMRTGPAGSMTPATSNVNVAIGGKISGRDIVFFQEQGAEFGDAPGNGLM